MIYLLAIPVLAVCVYRYIIYPIYFSPLAPIPKAHFTSPFLPTWLWWIRNYRCREVSTIYALHKKLGPIVQLAPNEVSVNSANGLKTIYLGGFPKDNYYEDLFMNYERYPNLASMLSFKAHSEQKRMVSRVYSKSFILASEDLRVASEKLIWERYLPMFERIAQPSSFPSDREEERMNLGPDKTLNVFPPFQAMGMDFMTAYLFGIDASTDFLRDTEYRDHWLKLYSVFKTQLPKQRAFGEVENLCLKMCDQVASQLSCKEKGEAEFKTGSTKPVVYGQLFNGIFSQINPDSDAEKADARFRVASEMMDHIVAGHETTGITLTYIVYEMSQNPELQAKLREELLTLSPPIFYKQDSTLESSNTEKEKGSKLPSFHALDELPLLNGIVHETLRVYPAAPLPLPRVVPAGKPVELEGYQIPAGTRVMSSAYTLHRNPEVFPEPEGWKPHRWIEADKTQLEKMRRLFWAFGSGGRMCLGSNFALQDIKLAIASLYTNYTTFIVGNDSMEQTETFIAQPVSGKLIIGVKHV
ncbi:hypothetical protein TESG_07063 [Trichophyton tonsurans CBS 112818]|uniref:Cytochrome P450 monooxygenase n=1 Tax=Trichophyton tonsurans (strain CBS 112818) TaxID=647933 RepID=F2S835_TRIT1|nr:hypothetical protein TESG_07063 [Trichophyton tonsurans CBS 112818]